MYRPNGLLEWNKRTHDSVESLGILPPQTEFPIVVPSGFEWGLLRRQIFEAGADAMLEALRSDRYIDCSKLTNTVGLVLNDIPPKFKMKKDFKGWIVFIPDEVEDATE